MRKWLITVIILLFIIGIEVCYLVYVPHKKTVKIHKQQVELSRMMDHIEFQTDQLQIKLVAIREHVGRQNQNDNFNPVFTYQLNENPTHNWLEENTVSGDN